MQKLTNFAGGMRHGWDIQFGAGRHQTQLQHPHAHAHAHASHAHQYHTQHTHPDGARTPTYQRQQTPAMTHLPPGTPMSWCFKVPFNNTLQGPDTSLLIYSSKGAIERWSFANLHEDASADMPVHRLPVHMQHVEDLRLLCAAMKERLGVDASVTVGKATSLAPVPGLQPTLTNNVAANVCLHGPNFEMVRRVREHILNQSPITLQSATIPIDRNKLFQDGATKISPNITAFLDQIAERTKADIFLLDPEERKEDGSCKSNSKEQLKLMVYGDMLTKENAKVRILILIDQMVSSFDLLGIFECSTANMAGLKLGMQVDTMKIELQLHSLICGRARKKIKAIESATDTAIYFPPTFPAIHQYHPDGAERRPFDEIVVTGPDAERIFKAKTQLNDLVFGANHYVKDVRITPSKMDHLLLERLDKMSTIMEAHASFLALPSIGQYNGLIRVQGLDVLNVERTIRELMGLTTQFYSAEWQCTAMARSPSDAQISTMLTEIGANSGADVAFANMTFYVFGSDEACRTALNVISNIPFVKLSNSSIHIKLELACEHKEFVSGKKNGKINKIMNTANVQIVFDGFNDYNFYIDVRGTDYQPTIYGLELVEMELPASLSFHVPDQYHKRIIGIGGQHIQQLMKKYSVFVKFSNAHDRGPTVGKEDDTLKLDNVICRTPSRNAQNLELVKQEIMDMVNRPDAEQVTEQVTFDRLLHRELISSRMGEIEDLEKKWNCKITFPSTEQASDVVQVSGPEFQVPSAIYDLLAMVPESHEVSFTAKPELKDYLRSADFENDVVQKLKSQHVVDINKKDNIESQGDQEGVETYILSYTRNDAGGLKDAIDFLISRLLLKGLEAETVRGSIPRPKSDSFEDSLPYFESKLLHKADRTLGTDSPTRSQFGDADSSESPSSMSFFSKFRKQGSISSFSSFMDRRHNGTSSTGPGVLKHASSNASKASLTSIESQGSGFRSIWNDSTINLPEEEVASAPSHSMANGHVWSLPQASGSSHYPLALPTHQIGLSTPATFAHTSAFVFNNNNNNSSSSNGLMNSTNGIHHPSPHDDQTPTSRYDARASVDNGCPSTSYSISRYPGPLGHHR